MEPSRLLAIAATSGAVSAELERSRWPLHVTLAGNFHVDETNAVSDLISSVAEDVTSFDVKLGPTDHFGQVHDIPVLLAEHPTFYRLHTALAAELKKLLGFSAVEPAFWETGYRPHATLGEAAGVRDGDTMTIRWVTLVLLQSNTGSPISAVKLS